MVRNHAAQHASNEVEYMDFAQEAVLAVLEYYDRNPDSEDPKKNASTAAIRRHLNKLHEQEKLQKKLKTTVPGPEQDSYPEDMVCRKEISQLVRDLASKVLSEKELETVKLAFGIQQDCPDELDQVEVGQLLSVGKACISARLVNAKDRLRGPLFFSGECEDFVPKGYKLPKSKKQKIAERHKAKKQAEAPRYRDEPALRGHPFSNDPVVAAAEEEYMVIRHGVREIDYVKFQRWMYRDFDRSDYE